MASCGGREKESEQHVFTSDELYLIEEYTKVRRAGSYYPGQPLLADSLLTELAAEVDSARIARTVSTLSNSPERWPPLFEEIEKRLRDVSRDAPEDHSEQSRS